MKLIYSLRKDKKSIKQIQKVTLTTEKYGISTEHGLFGSEEWWKSIDENKLELKTIEGTISKVYMSGHNDFPEFKVLSNGIETSWVRMGNEKLYKEGAEVKLEYVQTKNRFDHTYGRTLVNVWVS